MSTFVQSLTAENVSGKLLKSAKVRGVCFLEFFILSDVFPFLLILLAQKNIYFPLFSK